MSLKNKVVVITGAAEGIGFEIAQNYLQNKAKVILLDINETKGFQAVKQLASKYGDDRAYFFKCDVRTDLEEIFVKIIDIFKTVDVLVNNAGILENEQPKKTIDVNVTALVNWSLKFWGHMRTDKGGVGGTIVNVASIYSYKIYQFAPLYQATKFAVMGFTKSLGHIYNYNRSGVKVIAICPGFTETKLTGRPDIWDDDIALDLLKFNKAQTWQKADVVGKAAVEIFSKPSGTVWQIEGGLPIKEIILDSRVV